MKNDGPNNVKFKDGQTIQFAYPQSKLTGILWGEKEIIVEGTMELIDKQNNLKALLFFKQNKNHEFKGKFYSCKSQGLAKIKEVNKLSEIRDI